MVLDPWRATLKRPVAIPIITASASSLLPRTDDTERDWPAVRAAERYRGEVYRSFNKDEAPPEAFQVTRGKPASRRHGWSATSSTV